MSYKIAPLVTCLVACCTLFAATSLTAVNQGDKLSILDLQYQEHKNEARLILHASLPFIFRILDDGPGTLIIETDSADTTALSPEIRIGSDSIDTINVNAGVNEKGQEVTMITVHHNPALKYKATLKGRRLFIDFTSRNPEVKKSAAVTSKTFRSVKTAKDKAPEPENKPVAKTQKPKTTGTTAKTAAKTTSPKNVVSGVARYDITALSIVKDNSDVAITVTLNRKVARSLYRIVTVSGAPRFVIDFHGAVNRLPKKNFAADNLYFSKIRSSQYAVSPYPISRIVVDLKVDSVRKPQIMEHDNELIVLFSDNQSSKPGQQKLPAVKTASKLASKLEAVETIPLKETQSAETKPAPETKIEEVNTAETKQTAEQTQAKQTAANAKTTNKELDTTQAKQLIAEQMAKMESPVLKQVSSEPQIDIAGKIESQQESPVPAQKEQPVSVLPVGSDSEQRTEENVSSGSVEPTAQKATPDTSKKKIDSPGDSPKTVSSSANTGGKSAKKTTSSYASPKEARTSESRVSKKSVKSEKEQIRAQIDLFSKQFPDDLNPGMKPLNTSKMANTPARRNTSKPQEVPSQQPPRNGAGIDLFQTRELSEGERRYRGQKVTLEFSAIPLRSLILLLGQMTDKNFIVDPSVKEFNIGMSLRQVPWDQALDIILDYHGLGKTEEGNVIRIASRAKLTREATERRQLATERALAVPLRQVAKPINYAKASELAALVRRNISAKGEIVVDKRTNTMVITDIPSKVEEHLNLIEALDIPTKQVIIEARIVETTRDFINEFGLQFGFRGSATSEYGTSTSMVFPNQVTISGGMANFTTPGVPFAVNLPAQSTNSSILGSFSNISGSFVLDAILTAAESERKVRVLSRPRISAQNNTRAEIQSGQEVPFQVIQNNTVSIRFREATLKLEVTPHITSDNMVIMDVVIHKDSLGIQTPAGFTIQTRRATSTILVKDGGVAVIGGVLEVSDSSSRDATPFLSKLPIIGRLFRNSLERVQNTELLIFISPKIIG